MNNNDEELSAIEQRYRRRSTLPEKRYSRLNFDVHSAVQQRQRATIQLLRENGIHSLSHSQIVEIGCGNGANLLEFLLMGAEPHRIIGNEMLAERLQHARDHLPSGVKLLPGNAVDLQLPENSVDIVYQSTVFSSILSEPLQVDVAAAMWRWLRPGGAVLWYDFTFDNPRNPDVRGVPLKRVRELFPGGIITTRRVTLAPPLARVVVQWHPSLYSVFNSVPWLRTHILCWIRKP